MTLTVRAPDVPDGVTGRVTLVVVTPTEVLERDAGTVTLHRGSATCDTTLAYPYDTAMAGDYEVHAEIAFPSGQRVSTEAPARYAVRKVHWFS